MTLTYGDLRKGMPIELDGEPYVIVEYEQSKMQKRAPVMRIRFRSLRTGKVLDRSFQGFGVKFTSAAVERKTAKYIYNDVDLYYFMDNDSFDQFPLAGDLIGEALPYLVEQIEVEIVYYEGDPIAIDLPTTVDLGIVETEPGFKGDTAQGGTKPAVLETGLKLQVPLFVNERETIRVDTRSGEYISRV